GVREELPLLLFEACADTRLEECAEYIVLEFVLRDRDAFKLLHHISDFIRRETVFVDDSRGELILVVAEIMFERVFIDAVHLRRQFFGGLRLAILQLALETI